MNESTCSESRLTPEILDAFRKKYSGRVITSDFLLNFVFDAIGISFVHVWKCNYCNSLVSGLDEKCRNCGASK